MISWLGRWGPTNLTDLQEDGRVLLVEPHQLQVPDGVYDTHGGSRHSHGDGQQDHTVTQRYDGKNEGDDERRGEEGRQGGQ